MTHPRMRVLPGLLLSLPLLACAADNDDATTGTSTTSTPDTSTTTTSGTTGDGPASGSDTGSSGTTTSAGSTGEDSTGVVGTSGDDTTGTGTTGDATTGAGTTGDSTSTSTGEPAGLSWALDVYPVIVANNCGCHAKDGAGGLTMTNEIDSYAILVGVKAWYSDLKRVEPGEPENSYLLHKLKGTQDKVNGHGAQMPFGGAPLAKEKIDLVAQWISEGALP